MPIPREWFFIGPNTMKKYKPRKEKGATELLPYEKEFESEFRYIKPKN